MQSLSFSLLSVFFTFYSGSIQFTYFCFLYFSLITSWSPSPHNLYSMSFLGTPKHLLLSESFLNVALQGAKVRAHSHWLHTESSCLALPSQQHPQPTQDPNPTFMASHGVKGTQHPSLSSCQDSTKLGWVGREEIEEKHIIPLPMLHGSYCQGAPLLLEWSSWLIMAKEQPAITVLQG